MQLRHIRYLMAVAEHGNFTRAAAALHVSQPTLSQQIIQLEDRLGVALLDRSGRVIKPTDVGREYIDHARQALRELDAARRAIHDVQDLSRGTLSLATTPTFTSYLVGPLIASFHARYPGIVIKLKEMSLDTISAAVAADEVELGIAFHVERSAEVDCQPLFVEKLSVVAGTQHPWAEARTAIGPNELAEARLALLSADFATRTHVDSYLREQGITPRIAIEANTIGALIEVIRRADLITILPEEIGKAHPGLVNFGITPAMPHRTVMLVRRSGGYQSAAAMAFAKMVEQYEGRM
jgi:LysR family cyn operon transcriptional activator